MRRSLGACKSWPALTLLTWPVWHGCAWAAGFLGTRLGFAPGGNGLTHATALALGGAAHLAIAVALRLFSPRALAARMGGSRA